MECIDCGKICKNKQGLSIHKSSCINKVNPLCPFCKEKYFNNQSLKRHVEVCKERIRIKQEEEYEEQKQIELQRLEHQKQAELQRLELENQSEVERLKSIINKLKHQNHLDSKVFETKIKCLEKEVEYFKANPLVNNTINVNNGVMNNLIPVTDDLISSAAKKIDPLVHKTFEDMCDVLVGELKYSAVLTDISRKTLEVNIDGKIVTDPQGMNICEKIAGNQAIKDKSQEYKDVYVQKEKDKLNRELEHIRKVESDRKKHQDEISKDKSQKRSQTRSSDILYDSESESEEDRPTDSDKSQKVQDTINTVDTLPAESLESFSKIIVESAHLSNPKMLQKRLPRRFNHKKNQIELPAPKDPLDGIKDKVQRFCERGIGGIRGYLDKFLFGSPESIALCLDDYFDIKKYKFNIDSDKNHSQEKTLLDQSKIEIIIRSAFLLNCPGLQISDSVCKALEKSNKQMKEALDQFKANLRWARNEIDDEVQHSFMKRVMNLLSEDY
jgi:hypothetical protein